MPLRTPRRRISPQTRQRYRAIKDFFKRTLGSSSQPILDINSNIGGNALDLNDKIASLENQLSEVSRRCQEFINLDGSRRGSQSLVATDLKDDISRDDLSLREPREVEAKILYKTSETRYKNSEGNEQTSEHIDDAASLSEMNHVKNTAKSKKKKCKINDLDVNHNCRMHRTQPMYESMASAYSTSNLHSLTELRDVRHSNPRNPGCDKADRRAHKSERIVHNRQMDEGKNNLYKQQHERVVRAKRDYTYEDRDFKKYSSRSRKPKHETKELDQDFITDIIKRQYRPVKMFGRSESVLSKISEPLCRDHEFTLNEDIQEGTELCSCCYGNQNSPKHAYGNDNSDARSICDARLYGSKRSPRFKYRRVRADAYNDSELYDLIPVKEKSSPKSRRKFAQDNLLIYNAYKEVPPSPKSLRPRLNLTAQYYEETDDYTDLSRQGNIRGSPKGRNKYQESINSYETEQVSRLHTKEQQKFYTKQDRFDNFDIEQNNTTTNNALNKTQETTSSTDKTDRALCEIKDILQTFLQEIKKDSSSYRKSDVSIKLSQKNATSNQIPQVNESMLPNTGHYFKNYSVPQCSSAPTPYITPYPNACCYPVLPMYPVSCIQSSYVMPSQSFTCGSCVNKTDTTDHNIKTKNNTHNKTQVSETDELIKEIYKYVAQSPTFFRKQDDNHNSENLTFNYLDDRILTSRSAGRSTQVSRHDAMVGTPKLKCYSKSCEALGSNMISDRYHSYSGTNETYSDTALENMSLEASATTTSVTELSTEQSEKNKKKNTKFTKVLRSFGLFKKRNDVIEEESESESTIDVKIKKKHPFRQEITNYMMHGQEYYRPPPVPVPQDYHTAQYSNDYRHPHDPAMQNYPPHPATESYYNPRLQRPIQEQPPHLAHYHPGQQQYPTAPPYPNSCEHYNQMQPQVPLCLKEIEVKSMATQSERKMSFFRKIKQKIQPTVAEVRQDGARNCSTQTAQNKPGLWKNMQDKARNDPMTFSFKTQKKLANGDMKMRNAMVKKMFYKRNPFSPRNLIIRTLLGKDKSSYGDPPAMYRPRMFI